MGTRAKAGTSLEALVKLAMPLLREAERQCPRTGPGAKPIIPDWFVGVLIMVAVLKRKKTKSAQFRFVTDSANRRQIRDLTGEKQFPSRSTFFSRYRRCHRLFTEAIKRQGQQAIAEQIVDASQVAVDKSLVPARGRPWHKHEKEKGKIPRGVDREAAWGYSEHHGWVYGYSFEVVVSCKRKNTVFPLLASVGTGSAAEVRTFAEKIDHLPREVKCVSVDMPTTQVTSVSASNLIRQGGGQGVASCVPKIPAILAKRPSVVGPTRRGPTAASCDEPERSTSRAPPGDASIDGAAARSSPSTAG